VSLRLECGSQKRDVPDGALQLCPEHSYQLRRAFLSWGRGVLVIRSEATLVFAVLVSRVTKSQWRNCMETLYGIKGKETATDVS